MVPFPTLAKQISAMAEKLWTIQGCRVFEQLSEADLFFLEQHSRHRLFAKNESIYLPPDDANSVLVVVEGRVRLFTVTPDGKEALLALIEPGEIFGELALAGSDQREEFAQAAMTSRIVAIPRDAMEEILLRNPVLSLAVTRYIGLRRRSFERRLKNLLFRSNRDRLIALLSELLQQYGKPVVDGILIDIKLSHQDLASLIGITRESVTLTLRDLQDERLISIGRQRIVVTDKRRLTEFAGAM